MKILLVMALVLVFAAPARAEDLMSIYKSYEGDTQMALDHPHRGVSELGSWLSDTVADALQFSPNKANAKLSAIRPYFSDQGYKTYLAFLDQMGLSVALQKQTLNLTSVVNAAPLLIGQGASAGRYAWAYEMPVVLSAMPGPDADPLSKTVTLRIQIGRNAKAPGPNGVFIESWQTFTEGDTAKDASGKPANQP